jgi:hypothetical protein
MERRPEPLLCRADGRGSLCDRLIPEGLKERQAVHTSSSQVYKQRRTSAGPFPSERRVSRAVRPHLSRRPRHVQIPSFRQVNRIPSSIPRE